MNKSPLPTPEAIETLTSYLPRLYAEGFRPVDHGYPSETLKDGSFTVPYPRYNPLVEEFFRHVSGDGWLDYVLYSRRAILRWALGRDDRKRIYPPPARAT